MSNILISICGRAGSTGFPGKNLALFVDVPLSFYSVGAAELFAKKHIEHDIDICLSTDSEQLIEDVQTAFANIEIIRRPSELCDGITPKLAVFTHAIKSMEERRSKRYDYYIDLDITSPLRRLCDIENQLSMKLESSDKQLIFSAVHSRRNPYYNMVVSDDNGCVTKAIIESDFFARQQIPQTYDLNASIYIFDAEFIRDNTTMYIWDATCGMSIMQDTGVLDIDSKDDFLLMQTIAKHLYETDKEFREIYEYAKLKGGS